MDLLELWNFFLFRPIADYFYTSWKYRFLIGRKNTRLWLAGPGRTYIYFGFGIPSSDLHRSFPGSPRINLKSKATVDSPKNSRNWLTTRFNYNRFCWRNFDKKIGIGDFGSACCYDYACVCTIVTSFLDFIFFRRIDCHCQFTEKYKINSYRHSRVWYQS